MNEELSYKGLQKTEIPILQKLAFEIWHTTYSTIISKEQVEFMLEKMYNKELIKEQLEENDFWYFIQYKKENIGFVHFFPKENKMYLSKIYLKNEFHSKGIGKNTLDFVIENAKNLGFSKVYLRVNKQNKKAIQSYTKKGFKIIKEDILEIGNGYVMDDYILEYCI